MNKHIALIIIVSAMSGCATTWKHPMKLTGKGEMDLFYCKVAATKLALILALKAIHPS